MRPQQVPGSRLEYELTIAGAIGPVLRTALQPLEVGSAMTWTTLRTKPLSPAEFFELVLSLNLTSWHIDGVQALGD